MKKKDDNNNDEQDDDAKVDITDTDGNESDSEDEIMSENGDSDHAIIDRDIVNCTTKTRSGRVVIPQEILKDYETGGSVLESYNQAIT